MTEEQIKHMVSRFLGWKLPENFNPDAGITFSPNYRNGTPQGGRHEPVGTNLFDYTQAKAMVVHMIEGLPSQYQGIFHDEAGKTVLSGVVDDEGKPLILNGGKSVGQLLAEARDL